MAAKKIPDIDCCRRCPYLSFEPPLLNGAYTRYIAVCRLAAVSPSIRTPVLLDVNIPNDKGVRLYDKLGDALKSIPEWCPL